MLPFPPRETSFSWIGKNEANVKFNNVGRAAARIKLLVSGESRVGRRGFVIF